MPANPIEAKLMELPQARHFRADDIARWIEAMSADAHPIEWHIARLSGIGGSESYATAQIEALAKGENASFNAFVRPDMLVAQKLLRAIPRPSSAIMRRGNDLEAVARSMLLEESTGNPRDDLAQAMRQMRVPKHEWLIGNPDLVLERDGKIGIVDIKVPGKVHSRVSEQYVYQLHHYAIGFFAATKKLPDFLMIAQYDWENHRIVPMDVPLSKEVFNTILSGGDRLWNEYVLEGRIPELPRPQASQASEIPQDVEENLRFLDILYKRYKVLDEAMGTLKNLIDTEARKIAGKVPPEMLKSAGIDTSISLRPKVLDRDRLLLALAARGIDEAAVQKPGKALNETALEAVLRSVGRSLDEFRTADIDAQKAISLLGEIPEVIERAPMVSLKKGAAAELPGEDANLVIKEILGWAYGASAPFEKEPDILERAPGM